VAKTNLVRLKDGNVQLIDIDDVQQGLDEGWVLEVLDDPEPEKPEVEDEKPKEVIGGVALGGSQKEADKDQGVEEGGLHA
jgi:hypothetical protein